MNMFQRIDRMRSVDFLIRGISRQSRNATDKRLMLSHGITNQQGRLLGVIARNLSAGNEITRKRLEADMELKGSSITSLLDGLERREYIVRGASVDDRRALSISITESGLHLIEDIHDVFIDMDARLTAGMSGEDVDTLRALLMRVRQNADALD